MSESKKLVLRLGLRGALDNNLHEDTVSALPDPMCPIESGERKSRIREIWHMDEHQAPPKLAETSNEQQWNEFVKVNAKTMFQIALLLSGAAHLAENALISSLEDLNVSVPPNDDLAMWQRAVVVRSVRSADWAQVADPDSLSMLQPGLRPVLMIVGLPRIHFVLRLLLGYSLAECAQIVDTAEGSILGPLVEAATQLRNGRHGSPDFSSRSYSLSPLSEA
jgi:hypothetical protein